MKIEFIYTFFEKYGQKLISDLEIKSSEIETEENLKEFATDSLTEDEKGLLVKVSCFVYDFENNSDIPQWFKDCNGKLWFNDDKSGKTGNSYGFYLKPE